MRRTSAWVAALLATAFAGGVTLADESKRDPAYGQVVASTAGMVADAEAQRLARQYGLQVMNVTWEDTEQRCKFVDHPAWWSDFWARYQQKTGQSQEQALKLLHALTGPDWTPPSEAALQDALERAGAAQTPTFSGQRQTSSTSGDRPQLRCGTIERMANEDALRAAGGDPDAPARTVPVVAIVGALAACCFVGGLRALA